MAEYRWKFDINQKHTVKVAWKISGDAVLHLDGKHIFEADSRLFNHEFFVDGVPCIVKFANEEVVYNFSKLTIWAPQLFVNGNKLKTS